MPSKNQQYEPGQLEKAVEAVRTRTMGYKRASKRFGVPKTTPVDHVVWRSSPGSRLGRPTVLPQKVEEALVDKIIEAADKGFGVTKRQLLLKVSRLCTSLKIETPFKNGIPSNDWFQGLKKRHPDLVLRKPEKLSTSRARMLNSVVVEKYSHDLGNILNNLGIAKHPHKIWNLDETGKQFEHTPGLVIAGKGRRSFTSRVSNSRETVTVLACVNAEGYAMPPMCVVKGKTKRCLHSFATVDAPEGTFWTYQEKAWMCDILGEEWFRHVFLKHCGEERPQLLILDSHSSHEVLSLLELAKNEGISILALPPHTTHALQPLDKAVFGPFSKAYDRAGTEFLSQNPMNVINKATWPCIFCQAWSAGVTGDNIRAGFRSCGIYPFNEQALSISSFAPSSPFNKPAIEIQSHVRESVSSTDSITVLGGPQSPTLNAVSEGADLSDMALSVLDEVSNVEFVNELPKTHPASTLSDSPSVGSLLDSLSEGGASLLTPSWNVELDTLFNIPAPEPSSCSNSKRTLTSHMLLTNDEVIAAKRAAVEEKERREKEKKKI